MIGKFLLKSARIVMVSWGPTATTIVFIRAAKCDRNNTLQVIPLAVAGIRMFMIFYLYVESIHLLRIPVRIAYVTK